MGLANGAVVFPVAAPQHDPLLLRAAGTAPFDATSARASARSQSAVARGWHAHLERAAAIDVPDDSLVRAYRVRDTSTAADDRRQPTSCRRVRQPALTVDDEATIVSALARVGLGCTRRANAGGPHG